MSSTPMYQQDPYQTELEAEVLAIGDDDGRPFALLSGSLFYPEGGGQPPDQGHLGDARVVDVQKDVQKDASGVRHYFDGQLEIGPITQRLDWQRRFDHMQQHTAQHLLTAIAADRFGWPTTSFHLSAICDIEIEAKSLSADDLHRLEEAVTAEIRAARPISTRRVDPQQLADLQVRSRGLPAGHVGDVRLVEIEGLDLAACGGTHLRSTAEIETVKLLGTESLRGGLRLSWLAGGRVRQRLAAQETRMAELRKLFGAADDELVEVAGGKLAQLKQAGKHSRHLLSQLANATAANLAASSAVNVTDDGGLLIIERHFDDVDLGFLGQVARQLCGEADPRIAFLTAKDSRGAYLLIAAGGASAAASFDVQAAGRQAASLLDGRGGGSGRIFQGRVGSLEQRKAALASLEG